METCFTWGSYGNVLLSCFLIDGIASAEYSLNKFIFIYSIDLIIINPNLKSCTLFLVLSLYIRVCGMAWYGTEEEWRGSVLWMCLCCKKKKYPRICLLFSIYFTLLDWWFVLSYIRNVMLYIYICYDDLGWKNEKHCNKSFLYCVIIC